MTKRNLEYLVIGVAMGSVTGFVLGLLFAPSSGAATRQRLSEEAHRAAELAREVAERAERTMEAFSQQVDHYLGRDEEVAWKKVQELREGLKGYTDTRIPT